MTKVYNDSSAEWKWTGSNIDSKGAIALGKMLKSNATLTELCLGGLLHKGDYWRVAGE